MGNICWEEKSVSKQPEIVVNRGSKISGIELEGVKRQTVEKSINTQIFGTLETRAAKSDIMRENFEERISRLNESVERYKSQLNLEIQEKKKLQQQLKRIKNQSMIRATRNAQEETQKQKQKQNEKQIEREKQRLFTIKIQQKEKQIQQKERSIENIKSIYDNKIAQLKQEQQKKQSFLKSQLQAKQQQMQAMKMQLLGENAKFKQNQTKLRADLTNSIQKVSSLNDQVVRLKRQLDQEREANALNNRKLQEARFNQLFQNEIFIDRQYHKLYLTSCLEQRYNRRIIKTKLLFSFDPNNKLNFHKSIDQLPNIVVIVRLANGYYLAGFTEGPFIPKVASNSDALLISLTNKKVFYLIEENRRGITYDDYYIIFGNSELRLKSLQNRIFSNFGINNGYFASRREPISTLFGVNERQTDISHYEIYQIIFESI